MAHESIRWFWALGAIVFFSLVSVPDDYQHPLKGFRLDFED